MARKLTRNEALLFFKDTPALAELFLRKENCNVQYFRRMMTGGFTDGKLSNPLSDDAPLDEFPLEMEWF
ncbi:MAG: hypothetical protein JWR19_1780 [Pedosphaera sp.]|jgi:hypothetical protein|nr:hypothetical protein [Pedosphaera sp.]